MAPQSKKRKEPPQSTTLHKFFFPNVITEKKGKVPFAKGTPQVMAPPSEQVIAIHSDSEGHIPIPKKKGKGKRRSESSQEYQPEVVREKLPKNNIIAEGASATATGYTNNSVTSKSAMSTSTLDGEEILSFGEPLSLLRSSTDSVKPDVARTSSFSRQSSDLTWASSPSTASWSGAPVSLLRGPLKAHDDIDMASPSTLYLLPFETVDDAGLSRPSMDPIQSFPTFTDSSAQDHDDNLWAMGDDEMALVTPKPDDTDEENVEEIEIESSLLEQQDSKSITNCPICTVHLVGLFVTVRHLCLASSLALIMWRACRKYKTMLTNALTLSHPNHMRSRQCHQYQNRLSLSRPSKLYTAATTNHSSTPLKRLRSRTKVAVMRSLCSCPRTKIMKHGKKPPSLRIAIADLTKGIEEGGKLPFIRYCRECQLPWTLSDMGVYQE